MFKLQNKFFVCLDFKGDFPTFYRRRKMIRNTVFRTTTNSSFNVCANDSFDRTLLIVAFGAITELESIPLFELLYKKVFKNRLYCGPKTPSNTSNEQFLFMVVNTRYGAFLYDCLTMVVKTHTNYTGYFFMGEETLLNYWNIRNFDQNQIWTSERVQTGPDLYGEIETSMEWWPSPWGMQAVEKVFEYFTDLNYYNNRKTKLTDGQWTPPWDVAQVLNKWLWNGKGVFRTYWTDQTFVYLPQPYVNLYVNVSKHVRSSGVRHGIALPLILRMMILKNSMVVLKSGVVNRDKNDEVLEKRNQLRLLAVENALIHLNGTRKERREILNHLRLKEFAVGKFLEYSRCPL